MNSRSTSANNLKYFTSSNSGFSVISNKTNQFYCCTNEIKSQIETLNTLTTIASSSSSNISNSSLVCDSKNKSIQSRNNDEVNI